jgi:hypothetical protein
MPVWSGSVFATALFSGRGDLGTAEGQDHLRCEAVEVGELNLERGAERRCANDAVEAGVAPLDGLSGFEEVLTAGRRGSRRPSPHPRSSAV